MDDPNEGDIWLKQPDGVLEISIPNSVMPYLNKWAGRLQQELGVPIEVDDVAYVFATDDLKKRSSHSTAEGLFVPLDEFFEVLKVEAVRVFEMTRSTP